MRALLNRYVRSLAERESGSRAPEHLQDLGTYLDWLLRRLGYTIHYQAFKHDGIERRKSAGRMQWGCDILASKPDPDGELRVYRFVLKKGELSRAQWLPETPGSMVNDLWLAAGKSASFDDGHAQSGECERITVVAVHNGDFDTEDLGDSRSQLCKRIKDKYDVDVQWWDANQLVEISLASPTEGESQGLEELADASLFPPESRPFIRLTLDSVVKLDTADPFDYSAVDRLLDVCLHNEKDREITPLRLYRTLSELSLFVGMLSVQTRRKDHGNTLPVLDTIERVLCRALSVLSLIPPKGGDRYRKRIQSVLDGLVGQYVQTATSLLGRLDELLDVPDGLALPLPSERVDYPLRALRFSGYLSTAGLALLDQNRRDEAELFASAVERLWQNNEGGCISPVTDDQIIETIGAFELLLRAGRADFVGKIAGHFVGRLAVRTQLGFPLPGLWQRASVPMSSFDLNVLIEAHSRGRQAALPTFEDGASTLLPLAIYVAHRFGTIEDDGILRPFLQEEQKSVQGHLFSRGPAVHAESWQPPEDAAQEWYRHGIFSRGVCKVHTLQKGAADLAQDFEAYHVPLPRSPAERDWGLVVVDRMAWKLWRTPPSAANLIRLVQMAIQPADSEDA